MKYPPHFYVALLFALVHTASLKAQQWTGSSTTANTIYRSAAIKVGYGPLYLDWTFENNWSGNANSWAGYVGFNAFRANNDPKDHYYGDNPYTGKAVFEGSGVGFRWDEYQSAGAKAISFDLSNIPPGVYICLLKTNRGTQTKKLIVTK